MKFVLVPLSVNTPDSSSSQMHIIRRTYLRKLIENGLTPILVSTLFTTEQVSYYYKMCSGVLIMGGTDINPTHYGQQKVKNTVLVDHSLDNLEIKLVKRAFKDKKSILGICRGCQIINVALGGTLVQHIPDKYNVNHAVEKYEDLGNIKTKIKIDTKSKLYQITNLATAIVNCGHHQSIDKLGRGLVVSAIDSVGVVEAIESSGKNFILGIQSHPETQNNNFSSRIFRAFSKSVI